MRTRDAAMNRATSSGSAITNTATRNRSRSLSTTAHTAAATPAASRHRPRVVSPDSDRNTAVYRRPAVCG